MPIAVPDDGGVDDAVVRFAKADDSCSTWDLTFAGTGDALAGVTSLELQFNTYKASEASFDVMIPNRVKYRIAS